MKAAKKTTGPRYIAEMLRGYWVTHLFFVPQMLLETLTSMEGMGIRRVMTHGEKAAAYMADGYARSKLKPPMDADRINIKTSPVGKFHPRLSAFICG